MSFFSHIYPTHSRSVYDPTRMILSILYRKVPHMLPAKYQPNQPRGSGERVVWMVFTIYGHDGYLEFPIKTILAIFCSPNPWRLHMKFGYIWPSGFRKEVIWKCGRTTEPAYIISSPRASSLGELKKKRKKNISRLFPDQWKPFTWKYLILSYLFFRTIVHHKCFRIRVRPPCVVQGLSRLYCIFFTLILK